MVHKEAIETLQEQLNISDHFSRYPQDRHKEKPQEIKVLITTSEYHKKRVEELKASIALLVNADK